MRSRGRIIIVALLLVVLAALVAGTLWNTPIVTKLECSRERSSCTISHVLATRTQRWTLPLGSMRGAYVQTTRSPRGLVGVSLQLSTPAGDYYVSDYEAQSAAERDAARINVFLRDTSQGQISIHNGSLGSYAIALAIALGILVFVVRVLMAKTVSAPSRSA